mmetsp:Transcript_25863/g.37917  ORF Transcript_25863/g.37917 Transcript_25863/m.37917 type:complete len:238 (-) Transcript_25863:219-932(-)
MGSYCSIHNDTRDETVMVYLGANTKLIKPLLIAISGLATAASSGAAWGVIPRIVGTVTVGAADTTLVVSVGALAAAASGVVSATNWALDRTQNKIVADFSRGGYHKILPGQTYTSHKRALALNLRAWVVRIQQTPDAIIIRRSDASVWTGSVDGSNVNYNVMDRKHFSKWRTETIPIRIQVPSETPSDFDEEYSLVHGGINSKSEDVSWVHVNLEETSQDNESDSKMTEEKMNVQVS